MASAEGVTCRRCGGSSHGSWDLFLPISRRGRFFQDSFFSGIHRDFDAAVREVLDRWNDTERGSTDDWDDVSQRYRQLRSRNLKEENQAVTVTSDNTTHKIVLDVHEFLGGDVKVNVMNETELLVEGRVEKREEGSSSVATHSFRRFFSLPENIDMTAIAPVMSADGILTITAPKLERKATTIPVTTEVSESIRAASAAASEQSTSAPEKECQCLRCSLKNIYEKRAEAEDVARTAATAGHSVESQIIQDSSTSSKSAEASQPAQKINVQTSSSFQSSGQDSWDEFLPITKRGGFFQDSFFSDIHQDFDLALRKVMEKFNEADRQEEGELRRSETLNRYRRLRSRDLTEESLAVTVTSDTTCHKITLDVHDFVGGDLKIRMLGANELVVQGCLEKRDDAGSSTSFKQQFTLPDVCHVKEITAVISSDGILTITAPKKVEVQQKTKVIPVEVEEMRDIESQIVTSFSAPDISLDSSSSTSKSAVEEKSFGAQDSRHEIVDERFRSNEGTKIPINVEESVERTTQPTVTISAEGRQAFAEGGQSAASVEVSSVSKVSQLSSERKGVHTVTSGLSLPFNKRGSFLDDSCFQDVRMDFQKAIKDVLVRSGEDLSGSDILACYRNLRSRDLRDETQAVISSEDERHHKFVLDVREFVEGGEVNVRAVSERELVVEGHLEKTEGGATSMKRFVRRFVVDGDIQMDAVSSEMSSDGVLMIWAPKKSPSQVGIQHQSQSMKTSNELDAARESKLSAQSRLNQGLMAVKCLPIVKRGSFFEDSCFQDARVDYQSSVRDILMKCGEQFSGADEVACYRSLRSRDLRDDTQAVFSSESERHHKFILDVREFAEGGEVSVRAVSERELVVEGHLEKTEGGATSMKRFVRRFVVDGDIEMDAVSSEMSSDGVLLILAPKKKMSDEKVSNMSQQSSVSLEESVITGTSLPIIRRGPFFSDLCFQDARVEYQKEIRSILTKFGEDFSTADDVECYRGLRSRDLRDETQAVFSAEGERHHKFILDVHDFMEGGEVKVKAVSQRELVIHGHLEKKEGGSTSVKRFVRRFVLPGDIEIDAVSSIVSSDGVLLVFAPKKRMHVGEDRDSSIAVVKEPDDLCKDASEGRETTRPKGEFEKESAESSYVAFSSGIGYLPIVRKGDFADDIYFDGARENFNQAVREVLEKAKEWSCPSDALQNYRSLRKRNLRLDNQAVKVSEDQHSHRVVMDVYDFLIGDVTVQLIAGKQLLVEGKAERQEGSKISRLSFVRRFTLPADADRDAIVTALSTDGVLTITSTKKKNV